jgi:hypothetical protein
VKKQYQTRLESDTADRVDEYRDENEMTDAEAVRRLVRAGLEAQDHPTRQEIADKLDRVRAEMPDGDDRANEAEWHRAAQTGTVISIAVITLLAIVGMLIFGVPV